MDENNIIEEISLRELIEIIIKRKKMIAIITAISIIAAAVLSFLVIAPTYESSMILMASNASDNASEVNLEGIEHMLDTISKYPTMNLETYRQQIKAPEVLSNTIKDLGIEEEYSVESLGSSIKLETITNTQLISIKMESNDPEKAAEILNKLGENFITYVTENVKARSTTTSKYLASQMEIEKSKYNEELLEQKQLLSEPRSANEVELELNALLEQVTQYKTELNDLNIRGKGLLSSIEVSENMPGNGSSLTLNQETGKVTLDTTEKTLKIELADVNSRIVSTQDMIIQLQNQLEILQVEYQDKFHKESIINQKVELSKNTYESFVKKYEEIRVTESAEIGESSITVISKAYPSINPVGPRKALNLAIAAVLGIMIGVFVAFFIEYWQATDSNKKTQLANNKE